MNSGMNMLLATGGGELDLDTSAYIIFTILGIIVLILLTVFLVFRVKKDYYIAKYLGYDKGLMPLDRFKVVANKIGKLKTKNLKYGMFQIDIRKYEELKNTLGEEQLKVIISEMSAIMQKLVPYGIRMTNVDKSFYLIMLLNEEHTLENLCRLMINNLSKHYELGESMTVEVNVNAAAGNIPEAGSTFDELIKAMEQTMVLSKRQGENYYVLYNVRYSNEQTTEYQYYQEIREAIGNKEFILHYQPIVETNNFEVVGSESLIRWAHKTKGILPPKEFLSYMEQTGDINWVGMWCVEQMIEQKNIWSAECDKQFTVSCNLSEKQILNSQLLSEFRKIIKKSKIDASNLAFEISDIGMYNISDIVKTNIDGLAALGCKIFIDDFGNRFSSPTGLLDLPIDGIKIGRQFWKKIDTSNIVKNTINILVDYAKEKGIMLVAVGVENREEMNNLRTIGINYMQGFLFSKQKDPSDFISDVMFTPWVANLKRKPTKPTDEDKKEVEKPKSKAAKEENSTEELPAEEKPEEVKLEEKPEEKVEEKTEVEAVEVAEDKEEAPKETKKTTRTKSSTKSSTTTTKKKATDTDK